MDGAEDVAYDHEAALLCCNESDIIAFARGQSRLAKSLIEVVADLEPVSLSSIIVVHMDYHILAERDIHHGPRSIVKFAPVEADVQALICHHDGENGRVGSASGTSQTVNLWGKEMEFVCEDEEA